MDTQLNAYELRPVTLLTFRMCHTFRINSKVFHISSIAHAINRWILTAKARIRFYDNPCGVCGEQTVTRTNFSTSSSVLPVSIIPPMFPVTRIICTVVPLVVSRVAQSV
jgi:hypothetical protein